MSRVPWNRERWISDRWTERVLGSSLRVSRWDPSIGVSQMIQMTQETSKPESPSWWARWTFSLCLLKDRSRPEWNREEVPVHIGIDHTYVNVNCSYKHNKPMYGYWSSKYNPQEQWIWDPETGLYWHKKVTLFKSRETWKPKRGSSDTLKSN